jgi:hypothetical protein
VLVSNKHPLEGGCKRISQSFMSFNNADVSRSPPPSSTITFERSKTLEPESGKLERERERERTHSSDDAPLLLRKLLSFWLIRLHKTPSRQLFWRLLKLPKTPKSLQSTISREPRKQRTSKAFIRAHRAGQRERERGRVLRRESDVGLLASAKNIRAPRYARASDRIP